MDMWVCVCVCVREREGRRENKREREREEGGESHQTHTARRTCAHARHGWKLDHENFI